MFYSWHPWRKCGFTSQSLIHPIWLVWLGSQRLLMKGGTLNKPHHPTMHQLVSFVIYSPVIFPKITNPHAHWKSWFPNKCEMCSGPEQELTPITQWFLGLLQSSVCVLGCGGRPLTVVDLITTDWLGVILKIMDIIACREFQDKLGESYWTWPGAHGNVGIYWFILKSW